MCSGSELLGVIWRKYGRKMKSGATEFYWRAKWRRRQS